MVAEVAGSLRVVMGGCGRGVEKGTPLARSLAHTANEISKSKRLSCDLQFSLRGGDKRENISIRRDTAAASAVFLFFFLRALNQLFKRTNLFKPDYILSANTLV